MTTKASQQKCNASKTFFSTLTQNCDKFKTKVLHYEGKYFMEINLIATDLHLYSDNDIGYSTSNNTFSVCKRKTSMRQF